MSYKTSRHGWLPDLPDAGAIIFTVRQRNGALFQTVLHLFNR